MGMEELITEEEKKTVTNVIRANQGVVLSQAKIAKMAKQNPNRVRYVLDVLIKEGTIIREEAKDYGRYYKRYTYKLKGR